MAPVFQPCHDIDDCEDEDEDDDQDEELYEEEECHHDDDDEGADEDDDDGGDGNGDDDDCDEDGDIDDDLASSVLQWQRLLPLATRIKVLLQMLEFAQALWPRVAHAWLSCHESRGTRSSSPLSRTDLFATGTLNFLRPQPDGEP